MERIPTENFKSLPAMALFLLTACIGLMLDLWTKALAVKHLEHRRPFRFIPGWLHFQFHTNEGAVFGLGQGQRVLFIAVSIAAIGFLVYLFLTSGRQRLYQVLLGMLLAGVLGNLYDRARIGHVRDMIYILPRWDVFPWIFNVADSLLCIGVTAMILYSFFAPSPTNESPRRIAAADA